MVVHRPSSKFQKGFSRWLFSRKVTTCTPAKRLISCDSGSLRVWCSTLTKSALSKKLQKTPPAMMTKVDYVIVWGKIRSSEFFNRCPQRVLMGLWQHQQPTNCLPTRPISFYNKQCPWPRGSIFAKIDMVDNKHSHRCLNYNLSTEDTNEHKQHRKYQAHDQF